MTDPIPAVDAFGDINSFKKKHHLLEGNTQDFEFGSSRPSSHDIDSNFEESVVLKIGDPESDIVEDYAATTHAEHIANSHSETGTTVDDDQFRVIIQRNTPSGVDQGITNLLKKDKWRKDLEQALEKFKSLKYRDDGNTELIKERARELAIDFESAPEEAITLSVLQAVPEIGQYVDTEKKNQLRERLKNLYKPVSYGDDVEDGHPLTWVELAEERDEYLNELGSYFERVKERDASVKERKQHMLKVFYAHQADNLTASG